MACPEHRAISSEGRCNHVITAGLIAGESLMGLVAVVVMLVA
jgi:uncharacterized oligopeptide transporter (OPT) family protein